MFRLILTEGAKIRGAYRIAEQENSTDDHLSFLLSHEGKQDCVPRRKQSYAHVENISLLLFA